MFVLLMEIKIKNRAIYRGGGGGGGGGGVGAVSQPAGCLGVFLTSWFIKKTS